MVSNDVKACILGLDGVLVDTAKYHYIAWHRFAHELGTELNEQQLEAMRPLSRMDCIEKILVWGNLYISEAEKLFWADVKNNWYVDMINKMTPDEVLPGVVDFLEMLRKNKIKVALSSASKNAQTVLKCLDLYDYFDVIVDGEISKKSKPNPECYLITADILGISPQRCTVFEDTALGVEAALLGGFKVVGVGEQKALGKSHIVIPNLEQINWKYLNFIPQLVPETIA